MQPHPFPEHTADPVAADHDEAASIKHNQVRKLAAVFQRLGRMTRFEAWWVASDLATNPDVLTLGEWEAIWNISKRAVRQLERVA